MTFIERMRDMATDEEAVAKTYADELEYNKNVRKERLFYSLTFKYYDKIKEGIENASKHGRQYLYMNFNREDFKANFPGLGNPSKIQRQWLSELCNPNSKYLEGCSWKQSISNKNVKDSHSVFYKHKNKTQDTIKKESFEGLNYDVWNNAKFTTVFSWDTSINAEKMSYYYTNHWQN